VAPLVLHSFPTRRSSDLEAAMVTRSLFGLFEPEVSIVPPEAPTVIVRDTAMAEMPLKPLPPMNFSTPPLRLTSFAVFPKLASTRSEEHTSELQSRSDLVC